jgi:hypothetical protein
MQFTFDERPSEASLVASVWRTQSRAESSFVASASRHVEFVITKQPDKVRLTLLGPETRASQAPVPADAEFLGITLKTGAFLPHFPTQELVNGGIDLPISDQRTFCLMGVAWQLPTFDNADVFVQRLIQQDLLVCDPLVEAVLKSDAIHYSTRTIQRRFRRATGVTPKTMQQIERALQAREMLTQGASILETSTHAGYYDQSHMTHALKYLIGTTPADILKQYHG